MKKLLCGLVVLGSLCSCAEFQNPDKVDQVIDQVKCIASVVKPYEKYFTKEMLQEVLAGKMDVIDVLRAVEISPADVIKASEDIKKCLAK